MIRKSALLILVLAARLHAELPAANQFPAGADPFAGQRPQNNSQNALLNAQLQQQALAQQAELQRQIGALEVEQQQLVQDKQKVQKEIEDKLKSVAELPERLSKEALDESKPYSAADIELFKASFGLASDSKGKFLQAPTISAAKQTQARLEKMQDIVTQTRETALEVASKPSPAAAPALRSPDQGLAVRFENKLFETAEQKQWFKDEMVQPRLTTVVRLIERFNAEEETSARRDAGDSTLEGHEGK